MKILFTGLEYDRYDPARGNSFEYVNFYGALKKLPGVEVSFASFQDALALGRIGFNEKLVAQAERERPDLVFAFMYTDELLPEYLAKLQQVAPTLAWFSDDHWRFDNYSRHYARHFSWVATTYSKAVERYHTIGQRNVIRSQWFCNTDVYYPLPISQEIDVSFVGLRNYGRAQIVSYLEKAGINPSVFGGGWNAGRLEQEALGTLFMQSRVNLNLTNPRSLLEPAALGRLAMRRSLNRFIPDFHIADNIRSWLAARILQIKARPFEIAGCGGFCISGYADDMGSYYEEGKEMAYYRSPDELAEKIRHYLAHPEERAEIARRGHERTLGEHTAEKRFGAMFKEMGIMR